MGRKRHIVVDTMGGGGCRASSRYSGSGWGQAGAGQAAGPAATLAPDLGRCRLRGPVGDLGTSPGYRRRYAACAPSRACPYHSPAAPFFRRLDRLTIDDRRTRGGITVGALPHQGPECFVNPFPGAVLPPGAEIPPAGPPGREVMGQRPPRAAVTEHVQDPVEHLPRIHTAWSSPGLGRQQQRGQHPPLGGGQVAGGGFPRHVPEGTLNPYFSHSLLGFSPVARPPFTTCYHPTTVVQSDSPRRDQCWCSTLPEVSISPCSYKPAFY